MGGCQGQSKYVEVRCQHAHITAHRDGPRPVHALEHTSSGMPMLIFETSTTEKRRLRLEQRIRRALRSYAAHRACCRITWYIVPRHGRRMRQGAVIAAARPVDRPWGADWSVCIAASHLRVSIGLGLGLHRGSWVCRCKGCLHLCIQRDTLPQCGQSETAHFVMHGLSAGCPPLWRREQSM